MSGSNLFASLDEDILSRVTQTIGTQFAAALAVTTVSLCRDNTISPEMLIAAVVRAHLLGACSALLAASKATERGESSFRPTIGEASLFMTEMLEEMERAR